MKRPKFKEGEVVIVQSDTRPEFNGEAVVFLVVPRLQKIVCRHTGNLICRESDGYAYQLEGIVPVRANGLEAVFKESSLRKKHEPAGVSFQEMMDGLVSKTN